MGLFRIVSALPVAIYNFWLFKYSQTNMREILTGASLLYFVGFGLMCIMVKEGPYPPPPADEGPPGLVNGVKAFLKQSFSAKFYWYFYLTHVFWVASGAMMLYDVFF
jgi:maltose/moltooligosaccharide transporter